MIDDLLERNREILNRNANLLNANERLISEGEIMRNMLSFFPCAHEQFDPSKLDFLKIQEAKKILLLGEEDFSFTRALLPFVSTSNKILTTCFKQTHDLSQLQCSVPYVVGVDATNLWETIAGAKFDRIFFMFPWPEVYEDAIVTLKDILTKFLGHVKEFLMDEDSLVIVTLYGTSQKQGVQLLNIAQTHGFKN